jgi:hypothetical protein
MTAIRACSVVILVLAAMPAAVFAQRAPAFSERYGVLSERNIFVRDRSHPSTRPSPTTQSSPRDPERSVWLAGVALEAEGFRAYVENQNVGTVTRLAIGDSLARGKITAIEIDAVAYEANGQTTWIEIGNDFANHPVRALSEPLAEVSATTTPTTGPAAAGAPAGAASINLNDPNLTVEQKLKLRRQQELKGR